MFPLMLVRIQFLILLAPFADQGAFNDLDAEVDGLDARIDTLEDQNTNLQ